MANIAGYVPASQVVTDAAQRIGDPTASIVGRPRYNSFVQSGLERLCFDIPWDVKMHDTDIPASLIVTDLPEYISGIRNIWLYGGQGGAGTTVQVHLKDNMVHDGACENSDDNGTNTNGLSYFANNKWWNYPDGMQMSIGYFEPWNMYYAGWRNGKLYLSQQCTQFGRIRFDYTGIGIDKFCPGEPMAVPIFAREAIETYVAMRGAEHMMYIEGRSSIAAGHLKMLRDEYKAADGAWANAMMYWAQADGQDRKDIVLYTSYMGYVPL